MLEFALIDEASTYDVSIPETYIEARDRLRGMGNILVDTIENQSTQTSLAQILTAQTMNDLGQGWATIFTAATANPSDADSDEMRFRWQPEGSLELAFPDAMSTEFCMQGVLPLIKAGQWRDQMKSLDAWEYMDEVTGQFAISLEDDLERKRFGIFEDQIESAAVDIFDFIFSTEVNNQPLFTSLSISWGDSAEQCIGDLYEMRTS